MKLAVALAAFAAVLAIPGPAEAGPPAPPNIIVIMVDDQYPLDTVERAMPFLRSRPGGHWTHFTDATNSTPLCCPSRATFLTGLYADQHGVTRNDNGENLDVTSTLPVWLHDNGYRTGLVGKYLNNWPLGPIPPGWDRWRAFKGKVTYKGYRIQRENGTVTAPGAYSTHYLGDQGVRFVQTSAGDQPFFLWLSFNAPHGPAVPPPEYADVPVALTKTPAYNEDDVSDKPDYIAELGKTRKTLRREWRVAYRQSMAVDDQIGDLWLALTQTGELDNTIILYTTDNGFAYGAHRWKKKRVPYEESVLTPLMVRYPTGPSGNRLDDSPVSNVDLAATIADLAGMAAPATSGLSFRPVLDGTGTFNREGARILFRDDPIIPDYDGVRTPEWKYVRYATGECELYDLSADPYELDNRCTDPAYQDIRAYHDNLTDTLGG
jgi:N-acetylglucosamine-6-sulfatase